MEEETEEQLKERLILLEEAVENLLKNKSEEGFEGILEVVEDESGQRQTIVHFIEVSEYSMSNPPSKEIAHACFEKIIETEWDPLERKRDRLISHGDLIVIKGDPCLYYCYVAFVDRTEDSPAGYQKESTLGDGIHNKNKLGQIRLELIVWSEVYPGSGGTAEVEFSKTTLEPGTESESDICDLIITPDDPQPKEVELTIPKLEIDPEDEEDPIKFTMPTKLEFDEKDTYVPGGDDCEFYTQKIETDVDPDGDQDHFYIKTFKITPETTTLDNVSFKSFNISITPSDNPSESFYATGVDLDQPSRSPDDKFTVYGNKPEVSQPDFSKEKIINTSNWDIKSSDSSSDTDCDQTSFQSNRVKVTKGDEGSGISIESNTLDITDDTPSSAKVETVKFNKVKFTDGTESTTPINVESNTLNISKLGTDTNWSYDSNKVDIEEKQESLYPDATIESNTLDITDETPPGTQPETIEMFDASHRFIDPDPTTDTFYFGAPKSTGSSAVTPNISVWQSGVNYTAGQLVTHNGQVFLNEADHLSGTEPPGVDVNWVDDNRDPDKIYFTTGLDVDFNCADARTDSDIIEVSEITSLEMEKTSPELVESFTILKDLQTPTVTPGSPTPAGEESVSYVTAFSSTNGTESTLNASTVLQSLDDAYIDPKEITNGTPFNFLSKVGETELYSENNMSGVIFEQATVSDCESCLVLTPKKLQFDKMKQKFGVKTATPKLQDHDFYVKGTPVKITTYEREDTLKIAQTKKKIKITEATNANSVVANVETLTVNKIAINIAIESTKHEIEEMLKSANFTTSWQDLGASISEDEFEFDKKKLVVTTQKGEFYGTKKTATLDSKKFKFEQSKREDEIYSKDVEFDVSYNKTHDHNEVQYNVAQTKRTDEVYIKEVKAEVEHNQTVTFDEKLYTFAQEKRTDKIYATDITVNTTDERNISISPWNLYIKCLNKDTLFWQDRENSLTFDNLTSHTFEPGSLTIAKQDSLISLDSTTYSWVHTNVKDVNIAREKTELKYEDAQQVRIQPKDIVIKFSNEKVIKLTPKEYQFIMEQKLKKLTPRQIKLIYEDAKKYDVIPKNFEFELFKETLKYKPVTVKNEDGGLNISAGECTTVNVQGGMEGSSEEQMGSVVITPKDPIPKIKISSTEFKEKDLPDPPAEPEDPIEVHSLKIEDDDDSEQPKPVDETIHSLEVDCDVDPDYEVEDLEFQTTEITEIPIDLPENPIIYSANITTTDGSLTNPTITSTNIHKDEIDDKKVKKEIEDVVITENTEPEVDDLEFTETELGKNSVKESELPGTIDEEAAKVCVTELPLSDLADPKVEFDAIRYEEGPPSPIPDKSIYSQNVNVTDTASSDNGDDSVTFDAARYVKGSTGPPIADKVIFSLKQRTFDTPSVFNGDDEVTVSSLRYEKGTDTPEPDKTIESTNITIATEPNYTVRNDLFKTEFTDADDDPDAPDYDPISTTHFTFDDAVPVLRNKFCYFSRVDITKDVGTHDKTLDFDVHQISKSSAPNLTLTWDGIVNQKTVLSSQGSNNKTEKRYKYRIQEEPQTEVSSGVATISTERLEIEDATDESFEFHEPTIESMSGGNAYIPLLDQCPHAGTVEVLKTGPAFDSTSSGLFYDHATGWKCSSGQLSFYYTYQVEKWTLDCGVWVKKEDSLTEKNGVMEGPPLSANPYYSYPIEVCVDGSVRTINVLSTDIPDGQSAEDAVGHLIDIACNQVQ